MIIILKSYGLVEVISRNDAGGEIIHQIDYDDFLRACQGIGSKTQWKEVVWPENCISQSINGANDVKITFFVKGCRRAVNYFGTDVFHVPFPDIHFSVTTKNGDYTLAEATCYVVREGKKYLYPFGNVAASGRVCFGSSNLPKVGPESMYVEIIERQFFGRITNDDYFSQKPVYPDGGPTDSNGNPLPISQRELLSMLEDMTEFPTEWLIPDKSGM